MRIEANFIKAATFIREAASKEAQLAVLPEYHLTSWVPEDPKFGELCGQWEIYLNKYRTLAKECNICIVPGTIVERLADKETKGWKLVNVAYFIGNGGEILGRYEKKNLWYILNFSFIHIAERSFPSIPSFLVDESMCNSFSLKASRTPTPHLQHP